MQKSFNVFIDQEGFNVRGHVTVTYERKNDAYEPAFAFINDVFDAETNFRLRSVPGYLKGLLESEAFRVAQQEGPF